MNSETIDNQIKSRVKSIAAHHACIEQDLKAIERLELMKEELSKPRKVLTGVGLVAVARREAFENKR